MKEKDQTFCLSADDFYFILYFIYLPYNTSHPQLPLPSLLQALPNHQIQSSSFSTFNLLLSILDNSDN